MFIDAILIDDDPWVRADWQAQGKKHSKTIFVTESVSDLTSILPSLPRDTPIFVDVELGSSVNGIDVADQLAIQGLVNIFLATAHPPSHFPSLPHKIKGIVGKQPPTWLLAAGKTSLKLSHAEQADLLTTMSAEQRLVFDQRMREYENALYGFDGSHWLDGIGTHYPDEVLDAWERGIYESRSELELRERIQAAWRLSSGS